MRPGCALNPDLLPLDRGVDRRVYISDGARIIRVSHPFLQFLSCSVVPSQSSTTSQQQASYFSSSHFMNHLFCSQFGSQFTPVSPVRSGNTPSFGEVLQGGKRQICACKRAQVCGALKGEHKLHFIMKALV